MRFIKVFLSAVFLFAFFNVHAQPITGAFGLKLGEYIPDWTKGKQIGTIEGFKDNFFNHIEIHVTPYSKRIWKIFARKENCRGLGALISTLDEKYLQHKKQWQEGDTGTIYLDGENKILVRCHLYDTAITLTYQNEKLAEVIWDEKETLERENIDKSKL